MSATFVAANAKRTGPPAGFQKPVAETLPGVVERIAVELDPKRIVLFGSYAAGTPGPDSDVDLLVVLDTDAPRVERYLMVSRLVEPRPFPLDVIVKTPAELQEALGKGDVLIRDIQAHGVVLYERPD